jgi:hypothetical protein
VSETLGLEIDEACHTITQFIEEGRQAGKVGWDWKQIPDELLAVLRETTVPQALELLNELAN